MDNQQFAEVFQEIADILEIQGANRFRILAYQKAARVIADLPRELYDIVLQDPRKLEEIPGIGKDLASKIIELIRTGKCKAHQDLLKHFDKGLLEILRVRGVGPKKVKLFFGELQIDSIAKLKKAAEKGLLQDLPGMGAKSEADILKALEEYDKHHERVLFLVALHQAEKIIKHMKECKKVMRVEYAGSLRRKKDTIGDIDILVAAKDPEKDSKNIAEHFIKYEQVNSVIARGETKTAVILDTGAQVDLRVIDEKVFGAALHYFTGSKAHNIMIRDRAKKMGLKISEYGVFKMSPKEVIIGGKTEEEIFKSVELPFIEPELREDRGEIEAALKGKLPKIVELKDLRGDLHVHSKWSDGGSDIEDIARAYRDAGYAYIAITDHSHAVTVAHGLSPERFKMQWDEIDEINDDFEKEVKSGTQNNAGVKPFKILKGVECDILKDGQMDLPDSVLRKMDIVIASIHSHYNLSEQEQTERVLKAFKNPYVKIFGHPTGRVINIREPYHLDMERIIETAAARGVALEIDGQPARLDLYDYYCKMAKDKGAKLTIDSDSHAIPQMAHLAYGISVARRGWLEKGDVLNALPIDRLFDYWKSKKRR